MFSNYQMDDWKFFHILVGTWIHIHIMNANSRTWIDIHYWIYIQLCWISISWINLFVWLRSLLTLAHFDILGFWIILSCTSLQLRVAVTTLECCRLSLKTYGHPYSLLLRAFCWALFRILWITPCIWSKGHKRKRFFLFELCSLP